MSKDLWWLSCTGEVFCFLVHPNVKTATWSTIMASFLCWDSSLFTGASPDLLVTIAVWAPLLMFPDLSFFAFNIQFQGPQVNNLTVQLAPFNISFSLVFKSTDPQIVKGKVPVHNLLSIMPWHMGEWRSTILHLSQESNLSHPAHRQSLYWLSYPDSYHWFPKERCSYPHTSTCL
jgi:hypothetical protein